jgi:hypothetical protein
LKIFDKIGANGPASCLIINGPIKSIPWDLLRLSSEISLVISSSLDYLRVSSLGIIGME